MRTELQILTTLHQKIKANLYKVKKDLSQVLEIEGDYNTFDNDTMRYFLNQVEDFLECYD